MFSDFPRRRRPGRVYESAEPLDPEEAGPPEAGPEFADGADPDGPPPQLIAVAGGDAGAVRILLGLDAELGIFTAGDANAAYDAIVARFGGSAEPTLRRLAVNASVEQGWAMVLRHDFDRAAAKFAEVSRRLADAGESRLQVAVEAALIGEAFALSGAGRGEESEAILEELHGHFGRRSGGDLPSNGFEVASHRLESLIAAGRFAEAAALAEIADRGLDRAEPGRAGRVAVAVLERCLQLAESGRAGEFAAARSQLLEYLETAGDEDPWDRLLTALGWDDDFFEQVDPDRDQLISLADRVARHLDDDHPTLRALVAGAMLARLKALGQWGEYQSAVATWANLIEWLGTAETPALRRLAAAARPLERREFADDRLRAALKGRARGDLAAAVELYDQVIARIDPTDGFDLRLRGARALLGRGLCLDRHGDAGGAARTFEELIRRYGVAGEAGEAGLRRLVALSRVFLAVIFTEQDSGDKAAAARRDVARLGTKLGSASLWDWIAAGFESGGGPFGDGYLLNGDPATPGDLLSDDPAWVADRIVRCFGPADDPSLRDLVAAARRTLE